MTTAAGTFPLHAVLGGVIVFNFATFAPLDICTGGTHWQMDRWQTRLITFWTNKIVHCFLSAEQVRPTVCVSGVRFLYNRSYSIHHRVPLQNFGTAQAHPLHAFVLRLEHLQCNQAHCTSQTQNHHICRSMTRHGSATIGNTHVLPIFDLERCAHAVSQNLLY